MHVTYFVFESILISALNFDSIHTLQSASIITQFFLLIFASSQQHRNHVGSTTRAGSNAEEGR